MPSEVTPTRDFHELEWIEQGQPAKARRMPRQSALHGAEEPASEYQRPHECCVEGQECWQDKQTKFRKGFEPGCVE